MSGKGEMLVLISRGGRGEVGWDGMCGDQCRVGCGDSAEEGGIEWCVCVRIECRGGNGGGWYA